MKFIRKILVKILGIRRFIRFASYIYLLFVKNGFFKKKYPELFFLKKIISLGNNCIDIGANVGYYSYFLSKLSGKNGKIFAIEPIPMFAKIWAKNVRKTGIDNLTIFPYALGGENKTVQMGIPEVDGVLHHGMTKITSTRDDKYLRFFNVEMRIPDELFKDISQIDFIKCDVEGYESFVFSNMIETIKKHRPMIQSELGGTENRLAVIKLLTDLGYCPKVLGNKELIDISPEEIPTLNCDFYFVP
ncbi:MAG: FkbM family methyltransferase [Bacteroidota bacterium]